MATFKKIKDVLRIECDCGQYYHDVTVDDGDIVIDSYKHKEKKIDAVTPKTDPPPVPEKPEDPFIKFLKS